MGSVLGVRLAAPGGTAARKAFVQRRALGTLLGYAVSGTGTLSYQWLKDGSPIGNINSPTLTLNAVNFSTMGTFTVVVSNGSASVTSNGAVLTVTIPPNPAAVPVYEELADAHQQFENELI